MISKTKYKIENKEIGKNFPRSGNRRDYRHFAFGRGGV